jgi:rubredoxin
MSPPTASPGPPTASASPVPNPTETEVPTATSTPEPPAETPSAPPIAPLSPGQTVNVETIWMADADRGWAVGGGAAGAADHVLKTGDGGQTWVDVTPPEPRPEEGQEKVALGAFLDVDTGWVIYAYRQFHIFPSGRVWLTHDGGDSWEASSPLDVSQLFEFFSPSNLTFIDSQHGWVMVHAGAGMMHDYMSLYRTVDGGQSWEQVVEAGGEQIQVCPKTGMAFADLNHGWITRDCGGVMDGAFVDVTSDGGATWMSVPLPAPAADPHLFDSGNAACTPASPRLFTPDQGTLGLRCVTGEGDSGVHTYLYLTDDGGTSWQALPYPGGELRFFDPSTALALSRTLALTTDGGRNWTPLKRVNWDGQFSFVDVATGWAVARSQGQLALVSTVDGGRSWAEIQAVVAP